MPTQENIIGGMLGNEGLDHIQQPLPPFLSEPHLPLINARSGIRILCDFLNPGKVWLPSFLCPSIVDAIPNDTEIDFYPVSNTLQTNNLEWIKKINQRDLAVFIDYFGFPADNTAIQAASEQGATILQDASQALLSTFERPYADFILYSPRKTVGVPDGGILTAKTNIDLSKIYLQEAPADFILAANKAYKLRTLFDQFNKGEWYDSYKAADNLNPIGYNRMTDYSYALLKGGFNYQKISVIRRQRYSELLRLLPNAALFKELPENVVPLGFPVITDRQNQTLEKMYQSNIFCPVHWPINDVTPKNFTDSHKLSRQIITMICDQRTSEEDLIKMVNNFNSSQTK